MPVIWGQISLSRFMLIQPRKAARGISVFTLSDKASDKEAAYIARQENKADLIGGPDLAIEDPSAANALLSMFQRETMNDRQDWRPQ